jgi:hypothetical protein
MTQFTTWIKQNSIEGGPNTHLFLNGGKACIPQTKEREFLRLYTQALQNKEKLFVVECRPDIFKFMIDIDLKDTVDNKEQWTIEMIKEFVKPIQTVMYEFYETDMNVICCTTGGVTNITDKQIKVGIHLIWPRHFINPEDAFIIRAALIQKFKELYGERNKDQSGLQNNWEDVFDDRIYNSNGYRMVGSDKLTSKKPRVPTNRVYFPIFVMDSFGEMRDVYFNRLCKDYEALIIDTSIRLVPVTMGIPFTKIPDWVKITDDINEKSVSSNRKRSGPKHEIGISDFKTLQKFMLEKLPSAYRNQQLKSVQRYPDGNYLIITDSKHCMNIGRDHNSCGIYFFGTPKGLYQKCLCPCMNLKDRIFGYCKDYTSSCFEFNKELQNELFPKPKKVKLKMLDDDDDDDVFDIKNSYKKYLGKNIPKSKSKKGKKGKKGKKKELNLSLTQPKKQLCKELSNFCDDLLRNL